MVFTYLTLKSFSYEFPTVKVFIIKEFTHFEKYQIRHANTKCERFPIQLPPFCLFKMCIKA